MKTKKKSLKAVAVVILLAIGLVYNYADPLLMLNNKNNYAGLNEINRINPKNNGSSFIVYSAELIKSGINNFFNNN